VSIKIKTAGVIGAGLAGCEAAWQIAKRGIPVRLYEMKPQQKSPAHKSDHFAELVCSNSLKAQRINSAAGLLKEEMRQMDSLLMEAALFCRVPAGGALAVDRDLFSKAVTEKIKAHPLIEIIPGEITKLPNDDIILICTGPLTSDALAEHIQSLCGEELLNFYDAAAPIVTRESVDMGHAFLQSRYDKGEGDAYINCPLSKVEYQTFVTELTGAKTVILHSFEKKVYEGCMPVEIMANRGQDTLRFGPLKPVGLFDPAEQRRPYAVVQLRQENKEGTLYNLVGFQTNLTFPEQKRVFSLIPALQNAEYIRYGVMHRNTFLNSPALLNPDLTLKGNKQIYFAGQITGVEGYMESGMCGLVAGIQAARALLNQPQIQFEPTTMTGALLSYITAPNQNFQPMGANFGILPPLETPIRDKQQRYQSLADRALRALERNRFI